MTNARDFDLVTDSETVDGRLAGVPYRNSANENDTLAQPELDPKKRPVAFAGPRQYIWDEDGFRFVKNKSLVCEVRAETCPKVTCLHFLEKKIQSTRFFYESLAFENLKKVILLSKKGCG